ncbi:hypothetical protein [Erythrobacter sp. QSSC1-22B]|nr:hypothetical protein [Erythrobacter sp. QSSC1-22B]
MSQAARIPWLPESNFPAIFLCAGAWITAVGHDRLDGMSGLGHDES